MKTRTLILIVLLCTSGAIVPVRANVGTEQRSVDVRVLKTAFLLFLKEHQATASLPSSTVLDGETRLVCGETGITCLYIGTVSFFLNRVSTDGEISAVVTYVPTSGGLGNSLRCVFIYDANEKMRLKKFDVQRIDLNPL